MTAQIKVRVQRKATVKLKVLPRFSATLIAGDGASVERAANGDFTISLAPLASIAGHSYLGNSTASPKTPISVSNTQLTADLDIHGTTLNNSIDGANDELIYYDASANAIRRATLTSVAGSNTAGVSSVGGAAGALSLGTGLSIATTTINTKWTTATNDIYNNNSSKVGIGTGTSFSTRSTQKLEVAGSADYSGAVLSAWSAADVDHCPILDFNRSKSSSIGTYTTVASGDTLGFVLFRGADGSVFRNSAGITATVDGAVASNQVPGRLTFLTADSTGAVTERMRIDKAGNIGVGTTAPIFCLGSQKFLSVSGQDLGVNVLGSSGVGGNITTTTSAVGQYAFFNSAIGGAEKRVATVISVLDGATNSGALGFYTANAGTFAEAFHITKTGRAKAFDLGGVGCVMKGIGGVVGDGTTPDQAAIATIITNSSEVWFFPGTYLIDSNTTWPVDRRYVVYPGAIIKVSNGVTLEVRGMFQAPAVTIFSLVGTGKVVGILDVWAEWWGATLSLVNSSLLDPNATTPSSDAINLAIACVEYTATASLSAGPMHRIRFLFGTYVLDKQITFSPTSKICWRIEGAGTGGTLGGTKFVARSSGFTGTAAIAIAGSTDPVDQSEPDFVLSGFSVWNKVSGAGPSYGLHFGSTGSTSQSNGDHRRNVEGVTVRGFNANILIENARLLSFYRCSTKDDDWVGTAVGGRAATVGVIITSDNGPSPGGAGDLDFTSCQFTDGTSTGKLVSINSLMSGATPKNSDIGGIVFDKCQFYGASTQLEISITGTSANSQTGYLNGVWVKPGCQFEGFSGVGYGITVTVDGTGARFDILHVHGSYFSGLGFNRAIDIETANSALMRSVQISDNNMHNCDSEFIYANVASSSQIDSLNVANNRFFDPDTTGGNNSFLTFTGINRGKISNNVCSDFTAHTRARFVLFGAGGTYTVNNNDVWAHAAAVITDAGGTATIHDDSNHQT